MDLNLEEQTLIAAFRKLSDAGKNELLSLAATLQTRYRKAADETESSNGTCKVARREERPETAPEPIVTE